MISSQWSLEKIGFGGTVAAHPLVRHYLAPTLSRIQHDNDLAAFVYLRCYYSPSGERRHQVVAATFDTNNAIPLKGARVPPCGVEWNSRMCEKVETVCSDMHGSVKDWSRVEIGHRPENLAAIFPNRKFAVVISHPHWRNHERDILDKFAISSSGCYRASDITKVKSWLDW